MLNKIMRVLCIGLFLSNSGLVVSVAAAEVRFVRPSVEVPVRSGQGTEYRIVKLVKDGDQVELLEVDDGWARVRVGETIEGWMPKRFLDTEAPPVKLVRILRTENEQLKEKNAELARELTVLKELQADTGGELSACIAERDLIHQQYQNLEADTADVIAIQDKRAATEKELADVQATLTVVQQLNDDLQRKTALAWFLAGAGVLFLGWIIGVLTGRSRKRRSTLL